MYHRLVPGRSVHLSPDCWPCGLLYWACFKCHEEFLRIQSSEKSLWLLYWPSISDRRRHHVSTCFAGSQSSSLPWQAGNSPAFCLEHQSFNCHHLLNSSSVWTDAKTATQSCCSAGLTMKGYWGLAMPLGWRMVVVECREGCMDSDCHTSQIGHLAEVQQNYFFACSQTYAKGCMHPGNIYLFSKHHSRVTYLLHDPWHG
jgi:hypothetical protein